VGKGGKTMTTLELEERVTIVENQVNGLQATVQQFITSMSDLILRMEKENEKRHAENEKRHTENEKLHKESEKQRKEYEEYQKRKAEEREKERKREQKKYNKRWGDLANKLGKVVEDIVAPNIPRIAKEKLGCTLLEDLSIRRQVVHKSDHHRNREFDTIAVYPEAIIFNETKESVRQQYAEDFVEFIKRGEFFEYFPEYRGRKLIPIFSSLAIPEPVVNYLTKHRIYALAMGDETMEILNLDQVQRRNEQS
jgi:hypothetical protein